MEIEYIFHPDVPVGEPPLAARAGDFVFFAGGIAAHPRRGIPDEVKPQPAYPHHVTSIERQLRYIYENMAATLEAAGSSMTHVMQINSFLVRDEEIHMYQRLKADHFGIETPPPSTRAMIPETAVRGATVTNDVTALALNAALGREAVHKDTDKTPLPVHDLLFGHPQYVQAVRGGGFIFTEGKTASTVPVHEGSKLVHRLFDEVHGTPDFPYRNTQIKLRTEYVLNYFKSLLEAMGASLDHVVKADIFKLDVRDLAAMDEVWRKFFPNNPPARIIYPTRIQTPTRYIEIELTAVDPMGPYTKEAIQASNAPQPIGHEPQAVKAGPYLFLSGQLATDYRNGVALEARVDPNFPYHSSGIKRQAEYILKNADAICQAAGSSVSNLVRRRAVYADLNEMSQAEDVWRERLGDRVPPTTTFGTTDPMLVPGCKVLYDLVAFCPFYS